jgi:hypothetical protein
LRKRRDVEALAAGVDGERTIQVGVDLDAEAGKAASARSGPHLEEAPVELHGVIVLDGARVLETADAVEVGARWSWPPGGLGVRRGVSEASIVAREKAVEHALGLRERARLGEPEFDDEAILEGAKEPFDPSLTRYEIVRCILPCRYQQMQRWYGETIRARGTWEHAGRAGRRSDDGLSTRAFSWPPLRPGLDALRARIRWCPCCPPASHSGHRREAYETLRIGRPS